MVLEQARRSNGITLAPCCALRRFEKTYDLIPLDMEEETFSFWETIVFKKNAGSAAARRLLQFSEREGRRIACENGLEVP